MIAEIIEWIFVIGFLVFIGGLYAWLLFLLCVYAPIMELLQRLAPGLYDRWQKWLIKDV